MKPVIASASPAASAKYIFTVNPLPNLHKGDFMNKVQCYYMSEGWGWGGSGGDCEGGDTIELSVAQRTTGKEYVEAGQREQ